MALRDMAAYYAAVGLPASRTRGGRGWDLHYVTCPLSFAYSCVRSVCTISHNPPRLTSLPFSPPPASISHTPSAPVRRPPPLSHQPEQVLGEVRRYSVVPQHGAAAGTVGERTVKYVPGEEVRSMWGLRRSQRLAVHGLSEKNKMCGAKIPYLQRRVVNGTVLGAGAVLQET